MKSAKTVMEDFHLSNGSIVRLQLGCHQGSEKREMNIKTNVIVAALLFIGLLFRLFFAPRYHPSTARPDRDPLDPIKKKLNNKYSFGFHYQPTVQRPRKRFLRSFVASRFTIDNFLLEWKLVIRLFLHPRRE
jgi:hypothetical protein